MRGRCSGISFPRLMKYLGDEICGADCVEINTIQLLFSLLYSQHLPSPSLTHPWPRPHPRPRLQTLCLTFCKITKAQAKRIISDDEAEVSEDCRGPPLPRGAK